MGVDKLAGTYLLQGQAARFSHNWLKCTVHLDIPTMIGWNVCDKVHLKSSAKTVTHLIKLPTLGNLTSKFPRDLGLSFKVSTSHYCVLHTKAYLSTYACNIVFLSKKLSQVVVVYHTRKTSRLSIGLFFHHPPRSSFVPPTRLKTLRNMVAWNLLFKTTNIYS